MTLGKLSAALWALAAFAGLAHAAGPTKVKVGVTNSATDVGFFIAHKKGYFRAEGIDAEFIVFDSAAKMIAPLASGELDVGAGGISAGLYNAVARGIDVRMVADKNSTPPGRASTKLLIRKALVDSGRYKSLPDIKGLKLANSAPGGSGEGTLKKILDKAGLKWGDVQEVYMSFSQQVVALQNGAIDLALPAEPQASDAIRNGAVRILGDDEVYPNHAISAVIYPAHFAARRDLATRFIKAYVRGVRDFNDAIVDGKFAGPRGDEVVAILSEYSLIKDPAVHRSFVQSAINPDGTLDADSLRTDFEIFRDIGLIQGTVTVEKAVDMSFVKAAVADLGPYRPAPR
jgi:NitT/TauT family transport system substrate-binding protein